MRWFLLFWCACACGPRLPETEAGPSPGTKLALIPDAPPDDAPRVLRLVLETRDAAADAFLMAEGELSDYYVKKLAQGELPESLAERSVPLSAWWEPGGVVMAPERPLAPHESYEIASQRRGRIGRVRVGAGEVVHERVWPPAGEGGPLAIYCAPAPSAALAGPLAVELSPDAVHALASPGLDDDSTLSERCLRLSIPADFERALPPPRLSGLALDPAPLLGTARPAAAPIACAPPEQPLGPGCVLVQDDRLVIRNLEAPAFWSIAAPEGPLARALAPGERFQIGGFQPGQSQLLRGSVIDLSGQAHAFEHWLQFSPPLPHVAISEVMANPNGPEPAQEWVELVNTGSVAVELHELRLSDGVGESQLPSHLLLPGQFALIVNEAFDAESLVDLPPPPGSAVLRVLALGKSGLSNAGEPLFLFDAADRILSSFPATPKPKAGISVARRTAWALDDATGAFGHHAEPGASPAAPNHVLP